MARHPLALGARLEHQCGGGQRPEDCREALARGEDPLLPGGSVRGEDAELRLACADPSLSYSLDPPASARSGDDCLLTPSGGCVPDFPLFYSAAALLGWEATGVSGPSLRLLGGPAYYRADEGGAALGLQGRLDVAAPALVHVALVVSVRGAVLPNFRGDALGLAAAGLGVRLQYGVGTRLASSWRPDHIPPNVCKQLDTSLRQPSLRPLSRALKRTADR